MCAVPACPLPASYGRAGMCEAHYFKVWRYGDPFGGRTRWKKCRLKTCRTKKVAARGLCLKHYTRWYRETKASA